MSAAATPSSESPAAALDTKSDNADKGGVRKESFQWSTPADEFAEDVGSDDDGEYMEDDIPASQGGSIVIQLGEEEFASSPTRDVKIKQEQEKKKRKPRQKFQCPKCEKIWNWPWELRRHVLTHYKEKERQQTSSYKCDECGRGFQWKRDLAQHKRLHTGEKLLVCSVCEKKFTTRQALLHHVVVHTGEKPFQCALCGNRFTQPANLRTHMKKKHHSNGIHGNKCPHCGDSFPSIIAVHQHILEDHQNIVAEEREAQTLEKMKREQEKAERERRREENRRLRAERRKEKMDYNDFRSRGLQEWEINYEFHIGEGLVRGVDWDRTPSNGELMCEVCDRSFGWRYEIMFHNLCHKTDEHGNTKNRVCPECDTAFKVPIGLKHHLLLHTGELPFLCLHCWRSFSSHIDLKLHIRKEHLAHLAPPNPPKKATPRVKSDSAKKTPKRIKNETKSDAANSSVNVVVTSNQESENGEERTILVNNDGSIVQTGDQDMIVVIQSDDLDQSQGLIVVDPSQLQQVVGTDGMPVTLVEAGETMILNEGDAQMLIASSSGGAVSTTENQTTTTTTTTLVMETNGDGSEEGTVIVADDSAPRAEDSKMDILVDAAVAQEQKEVDKGE